MRDISSGIWGRHLNPLWLVVILLWLAGCATSHESGPLPAPQPGNQGIRATAPRVSEVGTPTLRPPAQKKPEPKTSTPVRSTPAPAKATRVEEKPLDPSSPRRTIVHEVAPMESIWRLAKMYDVSEQSIYGANHLPPGEPIRIGQKLTIPNARGLRNVVPLYADPRWKFLTIHHTATEIGKATIIHSSHQDRGFWKGLGYHFLIDNGTLGKGDGQIEVSPRWIKQQPGAHCQAGGMNSQGIGIALVGNFNLERPTAAQLEALAYLVKTLRQHYRIPASHVIGHRDVAGAKTDCPGRNFPWQTFARQLPP
jgi:N-acetylmuramoyl-L-alanine amidase